MKLTGCTVLNSEFMLEKKDIYIENGILAECGSDTETLELTDHTVIPGLIDIHVHGFAGVNVCNSNAEQLEFMRTEMLHNGVTAFLPTTSTLPHDTLINSLKTVAKSKKAASNGADILGVNMEGPFISPKKKGAMCEQFIRPFSETEFKAFLEASENSVRLLTLAPEIPENYRAIGTLLNNSVIPSIGHTNAAHEDIEKAGKAGMKHATHLFNAMSGMTHREPGAVGGILDSNVTAELICDGVHIDPAVIRIVFKLLGRKRLILISDAIPLAGLPDGEYDFDGQPTIIKDGTCKLRNGTINGNVNSLFECVKRCVTKFSIPLEDAVYCASLAPAKRIGVETERGSIDVGKIADLAVIDRDFNLTHVIKSGKITALTR